MILMMCYTLTFCEFAMTKFIFTLVKYVKQDVKYLKINTKMCTGKPALIKYTTD